MRVFEYLTKPLIAYGNRNMLGGVASFEYADRNPKKIFPVVLPVC
jgi:hypothetical protein